MVRLADRRGGVMTDSEPVWAIRTTHRSWPCMWPSCSTVSERSSRDRRETVPAVVKDMGVHIEATCAECGYEFECESAEVAVALIAQHQREEHGVSPGPSSSTP